MGKFSRDKGLRFERTIVAVFQDAGIAAERIPLSGAAGGSFSGDITVPIMGVDRRFEAKKRAGGFAMLYGFLADHFGLVVAQDRSVPLVVLPLHRFVELAVAADAGRAAHKEAA